MPLPGRHVVLGVSGGIACYKSCILARRLTEAGATVDVVLTAAAAEFVRPLTFETLTGRPVLTSLWERGRALAHIDLAKDPISSSSLPRPLICSRARRWGWRTTWSPPCCWRAPIARCSPHRR